MATVVLCPTFGVGWQGFDTKGLPLNGGLINTYAAGGSTPTATYTTSAGSVQNANPIVLNSDGRPPSEIWLLQGQSYKFVLTDSLANTLGTYDNIPGTNDGGALIGPITATGLIDASAAAAGQIKFPAVQNASSNANTLDDYKESTWTPVVTFVTPGDLSVAYTTQLGTYTKIGNMVYLDFTILTSTFTFTTASGSLKVTGVPYQSVNNAGYIACGALTWQGITKAGFTNVVSVISSNTNFITLTACGSAQAAATIVATDTPTGGTIAIQGSIAYRQA